MPEKEAGRDAAQNEYAEAQDWAVDKAENAASEGHRLQTRTAKKRTDGASHRCLNETLSGASHLLVTQELGLGFDCICGIERTFGDRSSARNTQFSALQELADQGLD